ncbi:MAG: hypothetical protein ABIP48_26410, partial [Planctomycetota bacterium]
EKDSRIRELTELIRRRGGRITPRELAHAARRYRKPGEAEAALDELVEEEMGEWKEEETGGRPARFFVLSGNGNAVTEVGAEVGAESR